jgi:hypothetical protein
MRLLTVVYTLRNEDRIRLISARKATRKEALNFLLGYKRKPKARRRSAASEGTGYQTLINQTLRQAAGAAPVDEATLRRLLREELKTG